MDIFCNSDQNSYKPTYTTIINTIPENKLKTPLDEKIWRNSKQTEWRWRILEFEGKKVAEISYLDYDKQNRIFLIKKNNKDNKDIWEERILDKIFDQFVIEEYYFYSKSQ